MNLLEVEEIGFSSRSEGVDSCSISNVQRQWVPDRKTKLRESMITFCLALIEWSFEEAGVGSGAKRSNIYHNNNNSSKNDEVNSCHFHHWQELVMSGWPSNNVSQTYYKLKLSTNHTSSSTFAHFLAESNRFFRLTKYDNIYFIHVTQLSYPYTHFLTESNQFFRLTK